MSVIFETLQKLKQGGDEIPEAMPVSRRRRRTLSLRRAFLPLGVVIGVGVGLLVFFLWGSLGVHTVPNQQARGRAVAGQDFDENQTMQKIPEESSTESPSSTVLKSARATKGKLYLPPSAPKKDHKKKEMAQYLPPASHNVSNSARVEEKQGFQYVAATGKIKKARTMVPEEEQAEESVRQNHSKGAQPNPFDALSKIAKIKNPGKDRTVPERFKQQKNTLEGEKTGDKMRTAVAAQAMKKPVKQPSPPPSKHMETTAVHTVDRSAQMSLLAARLQQAVRGGDEKEVKTLLEKLESLKGKSDYVMRLKAFWYLKEGKYTMARSLLQQLINKNENDLETGINMAVLDIKTNRVEAARKRLRKLRRLHEENTMIPALLEKINR
jgi:tetratricopeptide (TPR) repeat protein